ncbi:hypothetical protein SEA_HAIMAS_80 [Mycobacterium phage Haimas]|nr:hypothetical protein SEA_HAIMAS_80 [Mycobacterium phage Haimas]
MSDLSSVSGVRRRADTVTVGEWVDIPHRRRAYLVVEWCGTDVDGMTYLAGHTHDGVPHVRTLTPGAMVNVIFEAVP